MINPMKMTDAEAREMFNQAIAQTTDAEDIAKLETLREYFTNPDFRAEMEAKTVAVNQAK